MDVWNWMKQVNCRSVLKAVELANAQAKLKEEQQKVREQQRSQTQQAAASAGPATPLGLNAWNAGAASALRAQSAAGSSAGDSSGIAAMVQQFEAAQSQMVGARPPPLMSVNLMESTTAEPLQQLQQQQQQQLAQAQAGLGIQSGSGDEVIMSDVYAQQSPEDAMLMGGEVFYCRFCASYFNSSDKWSEHCASEGHRFNIFSDRDRGWNFRQPPWHLNPDQYKLCTPHLGDPNNDADPGIQMYCIYFENCCYTIIT